MSASNPHQPDSPEPRPDGPVGGVWVDWIDAEGSPDGCDAAQLASLERARAQARVLRGLTRLTAPLELEGAVVSALNAGHREERAVAHVASLPRAEAPDALDALVRERLAPKRGGAPSELDGLVERAISAQDSRAKDSRAKAGVTAQAGFVGAWSRRLSLAAVLLVGASVLWVRVASRESEELQIEFIPMTASELSASDDGFLASQLGFLGGRS